MLMHKKKATSIASLITFNKIMGLLHFLQGVAVLVLSGDSARTITTSYLTPDTTDMDGGVQLVTTTRDLFSVELAPLVALFFFMSAFAHFFVGIIEKDTYKKDLKKGLNRFRWFEYSASASVMMVLIAMLAGVFDAGALLAIFSLTAIMNLMGLVMEIVNQNKKKISWLSYNIGVYAAIIPWLMIGLSMWASETASSESGIPGFVYAIYVSMFVFFNSFAVNMILQYRRSGRWKEYIYGEKIYIVLSLVAKSLLAWQVYAGTLQPV